MKTTTLLYILPIALLLNGCAVMSDLQTNLRRGGASRALEASQREEKEKLIEDSQAIGTEMTAFIEAWGEPRYSSKTITQDFLHYDTNEGPTIFVFEFGKLYGSEIDHSRKRELAEIERQQTQRRLRAQQEAQIRKAQMWEGVAEFFEGYNRQAQAQNAAYTRQQEIQESKNIECTHEAINGIIYTKCR